MSIYVRSLTDQEAHGLQKILHSPEDPRLIKRAQVILASATGEKVPKIAKFVGYSPDHVRHLIHKFNKEGMDSIPLKYRGGRPPVFSDIQRRAIVMLVERPPKELGYPLTRWSLARLRDAAIEQGTVKSISRMHIHNILHENGKSIQRTKTWKVSNDPEFAKKNR